MTVGPHLPRVSLLFSLTEQMKWVPLDKSEGCVKGMKKCSDRLDVPPFFRPPQVCLVFRKQGNVPSVPRFLSCKPISYCRFKRIDIYILQSFKPNAISGYARLAKFFSIRFGQVLLIFETKDIDRDSSFVSAHTNLKTLSTFSIGIFYCV